MKVSKFIVVAAVLASWMLISTTFALASTPMQQRKELLKDRMISNVESIEACKGKTWSCRTNRLGNHDSDGGGGTDDEEVADDKGGGGDDEIADDKDGGGKDDGDVAEDDDGGKGGKGDDGIVVVGTFGH